MRHSESYFNHSTRQVFESDANVFVSRLPYGAADGTTTEKYSALVYPVSTANVTPITALNNNTVKFDFESGTGQMGGGNAGAGIDTFVAVEIVTQDSNGSVKYTSISANDANYAGTTGVATISSAATTLATISADTLVTGAGLSATNTGSTSLSAAKYFITVSYTHLRAHET